MPHDTLGNDGMERIRKYPRTPHVGDSRLQEGDDDVHPMRFEDLRGAHVVYEEKIDGANSAVSFDRSLRLRLQSRGHFLDGSDGHRWDLFKAWARTHEHDLRDRLGSRYIVYGEWTHQSGTVWYDALPHHFHEFDVLDTRTGKFLDTPSRHDLLVGLPLVHVPVLYSGPFVSGAHLKSLVRGSAYKTPGWREALRRTAAENGLDPERCWADVDKSDLMEGIYGKIEADGRVVGRFKWIRADFLQAVMESSGHKNARPLLPNLLSPGVDLFVSPSVSRHP
jgi:hypothetical protein